MVRSNRSQLDQVVKTLDQRCVGVFDGGYHPRQLVGLLRARLGWLVVLGRCRKRFVHALVAGYRIGSLTGGHREARGV